MAEDMVKKGQRRGFPIIAVVMIAVGVAFILKVETRYEDLFGPILTLGFGVGLLIRYAMSHKEGSRPPFIGLVLTTVGAVLLINKLYQDLDLGALFMLVIGIMLVVRYAISKAERARFPLIGVVLAVLGVLLLLKGRPYYWVLPLLLIIGGILFIGRWHWSRAELEERVDIEDL